MFAAQYIFNDDALFSPWMPRSADNVVIAVNVVAATGSTLGVQLYHRALDETGPGSPVSASAIAASGPTTAHLEYQGLKELVRYRFTCARGGADGHILFRVLDPTWFDSVGVSDS